MPPEPKTPHRRGRPRGAVTRSSLPRHDFFPTVTKRRQITLPAGLVRRWGWRRGDRIVFLPRPAGRVAPRRLRDEVAALAGALAPSRRGRRRTRRP